MGRLADAYAAQSPGCVSGSPSADGVPMACAWRPGARASGRVFRVIRRKHPPKSMVVYRDDRQVALLPDRD